MVLPAPVYDLEESDVLIPAGPRADVASCQPLPHFTSVPCRDTEPNQTVTDHVRKAAAPRRVKKLPATRR
jgi:hypothetical protein